MKELNLSEKWRNNTIEVSWDNEGNTLKFDYRPYYSEVDVKEFIKRLKECFGLSILTGKPYSYSVDEIYKNIDKLAGDKLI